MFVALGFACGVGLFGLLLFGFWCLGVRRCAICVASVCCACLLLVGVGWFWAVWLLARCCDLCLCLVWIFGCAVVLGFAVNRLLCLIRLLLIVVECLVFWLGFVFNYGCCFNASLFACCLIATLVRVYFG